MRICKKVIHREGNGTLQMYSTAASHNCPLAAHHPPFLFFFRSLNLPRVPYCTLELSTPRHPTPFRRSPTSPHSSPTQLTFSILPTPPSHPFNSKIHTSLTPSSPVISPHRLFPEMAEVPAHFRHNLRRQRPKIRRNWLPRPAQRGPLPSCHVSLAQWWTRW